MAHNYQKIKNVFARQELNKKMVDLTCFSNSAFEYLKGLPWIWEEKIDGTSIGLRWNGERVSIVGHTDRSKIPPKLEKFLSEKYLSSEAESIFEEYFNDKPFTIYGEGISKETNEDYGFLDGEFIIYDICDDTNQVWWNREIVHEVAGRLNSPTAPVLLEGSIDEAVEFLKTPRLSEVDKATPVEGLVGRTKIELKTSNDSRLICKLKVKDIFGVSSREFYNKLNE